MREKYLPKIKRDVDKFSMTEMAKRIGISIPTVFRLYHDRFRGDILTWEKILQYYKERK